MDNVPVRINGPSGAPRSNVNMPKETNRPQGVVPSRHSVPLNKLLPWIIGAALLIGMLLGGWYFYQQSSSYIKSDKYQAVFLTNGQVYFGKLYKLDRERYRLNDIFYLQAQSDTNNPQATAETQSSDVQLVKLGSEVHGPEDEMIIGKEQVLFFENLKKDGKVTESINKYRSQKK